jgi:5'-nucleotidase
MRPIRAAVLAALAVAPTLAVAAGASPAPDTSHAGASAQPALCGSGPLQILLTNDDGYRAPGIRALYEQLRAAGHSVRLVAPVANASGSSTSFTWKDVRLERDALDPNVAGVDASPATAVVLGAGVLYPPGVRPDLVVSGINNGSNAGGLLVLSGTIGAALAGTTLLDPPVPGFAVNAERLAATGGDPGPPDDHLPQVATHFTRLLAATRGWFCERGRLVHPDLVLNVNYPARPVAEAAGTVVARQGSTSELRVRFEPVADGSYIAHVTEPGPERGSGTSDTELLQQGYVTVTPLAADLEADDVPILDLRRRLRTLAR